MRNFLRLAALGVMTLVIVDATAATRDDFLYGNSKQDGTGMPFRYFVPPTYDSAHAYPLILFLHGAGERGSDNEAQLNNHANGAMQLLSDANLAIQPVFMLAPQCPTSGWWSGSTLTTAINLIDQIATQYHIDPNRIYVTGLSMGGMGTWSAVVSQPTRFAAAVPMSGNGNPAQAPSVRAIPFWFFHAANDPTVNVQGSDNLVNALRNAGANTIYTRYDRGGHGIWPVAYAQPLLFTWLISQERGHPTSIAPAVHITQPTMGDTWSTGAAIVDLAGDADNNGATLDTVEWNVLGGASGMANGTAIWTVSNIPLAAGENLIRVIATGPSEHSAYGGGITFNDHLRVTRGDVVFANGFELP